MATGGLRADERTDSELVLAARRQDPEAFGALFERWYDRCWNVARNIMRSDDLAAEVAQDAMLAGWQRLDQLQNPDAFGGWLLRITRNRALTRLEREGRSRATGDEIVSAMRDRNIAHRHDEPLGAQTQPSVEKAMEIHDRQELVWAASAALGERDASLLDLHLRHGLTAAEIAEELGVEANAAHQQLFRLRNKLGDAIGSYLLWRNGRALCRGLAASVSGDVAFDRSVAKAVAKHQRTCEECAERRAGLVSPTKLFASVPFLVVPLQFKVDAAAALAEAGVPIDPSAVGATGPPPGPTSGPPPGPNSSPSAGPTSGPSPGPTSSSPPPGPSSGTPESWTSEPPVPEPTVLVSSNLQAYPGPVGPGPMAPSAFERLSRGVGWTTTRSAWTKSLVGAIGVMLVGLLLIALLPGVALSDLWPFGGEDTSALGSETLAGPAIDETSTTEAGSGDGDAGSVSSSSLGLVNPSTATTGPTIVDTTASTAVATTARSTSSASTATSASSSSSTETTGTTGTTATTTDTSRTTTTDQDTTSSSSTTETTETTQPPAGARIVRFTSRRLGQTGGCNLRTQLPYEAIWLTESTDSVELFLPNGGVVVGKPSSSHKFCGRPGDTISLLAFGAGGNDQASTTLG